MKLLSRWIRRLYDWVMGFSRSPYGTWALFLVALAESSFFPIPPDVLLIAMCVAAPKRSLRLAAVCTVGSVLGAGVGYWIGHQSYELVGRPIVEFYGKAEAYDQVQSLYRDWDWLAVAIAGFTPIPFKVFTIAAGAFRLELLPFFAASAASRGARFFIISILILRFGPAIQTFIERYLNWLAIAFAVLLVAGFLIVKYAIQ